MSEAICMDGLLSEWTYAGSTGAPQIIDLRFIPDVILGPHTGYPYGFDHKELHRVLKYYYNTKFAKMVVDISYHNYFEDDTETYGTVSGETGWGIWGIRNLTFTIPPIDFREVGPAFFPATPKEAPSSAGVVGRARLNEMPGCRSSPHSMYFLSVNYEETFTRPGFTVTRPAHFDGWIEYMPQRFLDKTGFPSNGRYWFNGTATWAQIIHDTSARKIYPAFFFQGNGIMTDPYAFGGFYVSGDRQSPHDAEAIHLYLDETLIGTWFFGAGAISSSVSGSVRIITSDLEVDP